MKMMSKPYRYIRYKWWRKIDLNEVSKEMSREFSKEDLTMPKNDREFSFFKEVRAEIKVMADTLSAYLSPSRALLFQKEPSPFTAKDIELREKILELYPRNRPTPLPLFFSDEPQFEIAE